MPVEMGDSGYEHECSRAELLGIPPPSYDEYLKNIAQRQTVDDAEEGAPKDAEASAEVLEEGDGNAANSGGKLEEINNILQSTQRKLNRFKVSYGSLTTALKSKLGKSLDLSFSQSEASGSSQTNDEAEASTANTDKGGQSIIGTESIVDDKDDGNIANRRVQNGQSVDLCHVGSREEDSEYREIELHDTNQVKSPETKKFLNFGFLNLGGSK